MSGKKIDDVPEWF
jgi:hypothetical protein